MNQFDRIYIEISNVCNLQCSFCPEVLRPKKLMTPEQFRKVVREVKPYAKAVTLHVMGEPLAHPQFIEILRILDENNLPLILTSNGLLLERHLEALLKSSIIKQINFSIHSFFDNFPDKSILPYLTKLTDFAYKFVAAHPDSFINFRLWNLDTPNKADSKNNALVLEKLMGLFPAPQMPESLDVREQKSYRLDRHIKLHFDTRFEWPSLNTSSPASDGFCYGLSKQLAILTEGSVVPCCLDKEAIINLGSVLETPLHDILASERALAIVSGFRRAKAVEALCQKCQFKSRFQ